MNVITLMNMATREKHHSPLMAEALRQIINCSIDHVDAVSLHIPAHHWDDEFGRAFAYILNNDNLCKEVSGFPSKVLRVWYAGKGLPFERV